MIKRNNKPEIRMAGFDKPWTERRFEELYRKSSEKNDGSVGIDRNITVATMQFKSDIKISDEEYLKTYYTFMKGDIAFEGHQSKEYRFGRFVENDIGDGIVSHIFAVFRPIKEYDLHFWKYAINNERLMQSVLARSTKASTMMHELVVEDFLKETFLVPDIEEQKKIGEYINNIDCLLAAHQQEINRLICLRSAMLDKMFPQNGSAVPIVRFDGYKLPWIKKEFSELFVERHYIDTVSEEYPQLSFTIEEGVIKPENRKTNKRDFLILDKANKKYLRTEYDDIIYNPANIIHGAIHRNALGKGCVSPIYKIFYTNQDSTFMECIVRHPCFIKEISRSMEGTVKKLRTLKPKAFLEMSAYIAPTIEEQQQIGEYFRQMDRLIEIEKEELEKIKHIKSACLEKMFV